MRDRSNAAAGDRRSGSLQKTQKMDSPGARGAARTVLSALSPCLGRSFRRFVAARAFTLHEMRRTRRREIRLDAELEVESDIV